MKHFFRSAAIGVLTAAALTASASAANFDHCADALNTMGLFQGTSNGYELDRTATRAEAATMLVRLLGKEDEAKALEYTAPFTDLNGWEAPYVEYLYENGLTSGTSDTTFSPNKQCSAQMYSVFLMRALGYSEDAGDFTYAQAMDKATELGIADIADCNTDNFLRDNVVAMSYTALAKQPKDSETDTLLQKLVDEGAVDATAASDMTDFLQMYNTYAQANQALVDDGRYAMDATIHADISGEATGGYAISLDAPLAVKVMMNQADLDASKMEMTGAMNISVNVDGEETNMAQDITYYYADGTYYMASGDTKVKMAMSLNDAMSALGTMSNTQPISMIESMQMTDENTLHMVYAPGAINSMITNLLGILGTDDTGMQLTLGDISVDVTFADGMMQSMNAAFDMSITVDDQSMDIAMTEDCTITATGDDVSITLPDDLDSYTSMDTDTLPEVTE